jgi:hypothetical protein
MTHPPFLPIMSSRTDHIKFLYDLQVHQFLHKIQSYCICIICNARWNCVS